MLLRNDTDQLDPQHGGYSDVRLWPCYMLISSSALLLAPVLGEFWGLLVVGLPTFWIMGGVAKIQEQNAESVHLAWKRIDDSYKELEARNAITPIAPAVPVKSKSKPRQARLVKAGSSPVLPGAAPAQ